MIVILMREVERVQFGEKKRTCEMGLMVSTSASRDDHRSVVPYCCVVSMVLWPHLHDVVVLGNLYAAASLSPLLGFWRNMGSCNVLTKKVQRRERKR